MVKEQQQTGQTSTRLSSLPQLRQLVSLVEQYGSDTRVTAALTQLESWVMENPTPSTSDRTKMLTHISSLWNNTGVPDAVEARFRKATLDIIYPQYEWVILPKGKFGYQVQAKIRLG